MEIVYTGYAMSTWLTSLTSLSSEMICVQDERPGRRTVVTSEANTRGSPQLSFVQVKSGHDESERQILDCVVCKKVGNKPITPGRPERPQPGKFIK